MRTKRRTMRPSFLPTGRSRKDVRTEGRRIARFTRGLYNTGGERHTRIHGTPRDPPDSPNARGGAPAGPFSRPFPLPPPQNAPPPFFSPPRPPSGGVSPGRPPRPAAFPERARDAEGRSPP